jgi:hypothetical protein
MTSLALSILPKPCHGLGGAVLSECVECPSVPVAICAFTAGQLAIFNTIKTNYSDPLANKQYQDIPCDLVLYLNLLDALTQTKQDSCYSTNSDVSLLISIVEDALKGAINAYSLNIDIVRLTIDNQYLHEVIHEYMSGKNLIKKVFSADGGYSILKGFDFAPLFKYYICMYGLPSPGQGFDLGLLKIVYDTLVSGGIDPGVDNFSCIPAASACTSNQILVALYGRLSTYVSSIKTLNQMYYTGQVAQLQGILTQSVVESLTVQLFDLAISSGSGSKDKAIARPNTEEAYKEYENIRTYTSDSLISLNTAVRQYDALVKAEEKIASDAEKIAILLDPVKLQEYAQSFLSRTRSILPEQSIRVMTARLKPHYARYVELYGFPPGGAFDPDKLSAIKIELSE